MATPRVTAAEHASVMVRVQSIRSANEALQVTFDPKFRAFRKGGRVVSGLTKVLKRTMWPHYNYKSINRGSAKKYISKDPSIRRPADGRKRGSRIHKEIEMVVDGSVRKRGTKSLHPFTKKILTALNFWGCCPVASEVPFYDPDTNIATAADLLVALPGGKLGMIEIKTGFTGTWDRGGVPMRGPFGRILDHSPKSQALVQLAMTKRAAEIGAGAVIDEAWVIVVDVDRVHRDRITPAISNIATAAAAHILLRPTARRKRS